MTGEWISTGEFLPDPADEPLYLLTLDWGFGRSLQLAVARFRPNSGREELGHWCLAYWPQRVLPAGVVVAWQLAPALHEPAPVAIGGDA